MRAKGVSGIVARQVVVFLENRPGHLAHVTGVIAQEKINIRSVTIASAGSFGLVKLIGTAWMRELDHRHGDRLRGEGRG